MGTSGDHVVGVRGLDIHFPFQPYEVQKSLMAKVLECIEEKKNGLLESPTGTGKTLSLLCSAAAWQRKEKAARRYKVAELRVESAKHRGPFRIPQNSGVDPEEGLMGVPVIIYASRTHSQLSQAARELKRSHYRRAKTIVLGSRDLMCVHEEVARLPTSSAKIRACHSKVHTHTCKFYNNVGKRMDDPTLHEPPVVDIEDIVKKGRAGKFCPFYMSRELVKQAEIVFMPYNYLLDPKLRSSHGIDLNNAIIILDEGHNIAKICEEAVSFELTSSLIAACIQEVTQVSMEYNEVNAASDFSEGTGGELIGDLSLLQLLQLKKSLLDLEEGLDRVQVDASEDVLTPISALMDPLTRAGFTRNSMTRVIRDLDAISTYLSANNKDSSGCDKLTAALRVLNSRNLSDEKLAGAYKVNVTLEEARSERASAAGKKTQAKVFRFWCFNPSIGLDTLMCQRPRCIILSSGTLSPIPFLARELQTPFPVTLSNPHIIDNSQLFATVVRQGPNGVRLCASFANRNQPAYLAALGAVVVKVCSIVPKGVLVFFPSYTMLEICTKAWMDSGVWSDLAKHKKLLTEPKRKEAFTEVMNLYYNCVKASGNGACLFAVCRGKISEGLDFADDNGRAVIVAGIPYAPARDLRVVAKKKYLDENGSSDAKERVSGAEWYQLEASRAINQAIGRIIRHARDYGAILLCDDRCSGPQFQDNLSEWVRRRLTPSDSCEATMNELTKFFGGSVQEERKAAIVAHSPRPSFFNRDPPARPARRQKTVLQELSEADLDLDNNRGAVGRGVPTTPTKFERPPPPKVPRSMLSPKARAQLEATYNAVGFNSQLPVFTKSFAAFAKSAGRVEDQARPSAKKMVKFVDEQPRNTPPATPGPSPVAVFWEWVKENVDIGMGRVFRDAIKEYHKTKDLQDLGDMIKICFEKDKVPQCVRGLQGILSIDDVEHLRCYLRDNKE